MWGLGAIRDGAAGLVKQGAGAVKQGVEAGAKLLENLDEVKRTCAPIPTRLFRNHAHPSSCKRNVPRRSEEDDGHPVLCAYIRV